MRTAYELIKSFLENSRRVQTRRRHDLVPKGIMLQVLLNVSKESKH